MPLGLTSFVNLGLRSFAVTPVSLKIGTLFSWRVRAMGSKRLLSNSSTPVSPVDTDRKDKKLKGLVGSRPSFENSVVKENEVHVEVDEIQHIRDNPGKLEIMTVQQLRTTLRSVGVSAKGRKSELLSALKCFMDQKIDVQNSSENISVKRMDDNLSDEDNTQDANTVLEVSRLQKSKRQVKKSSNEDKTIKVDTQVVTTKQKQSIKTDEISVDISTSQSEPWLVLAHKKPQKHWIPYNPRTMRPPPLTRDTKSVKFMSWNVNGLRALLKLEGFSALQLAQREDFDVLCLQETKLQEKDVEDIRQCLISGYESCYWTCSVSKLGYSGTAIISRIKPLSVRYGLGISDHDSEGRLVTAEFDSFYLICGYVPNSGDGLKRLSYRVNEWDTSLGSYIKELEKSKPVILTGDLNCAHEEIDIYNPAGNKRSAGFTIEERQSFEANFLSKGFVDTFRKQHPGVVGYTYWGYRHGGRKNNRGWRLDYFLVSESIADKVHDSYILPDVTGSDHCPIGLVLRL